MFDLYCCKWEEPDGEPGRSLPHSLCGPLLSSVPVLLDQLSGQRDGVQVCVRVCVRLRGSAPRAVGLGQRVNHGHVHVQVVCFLEALLAHQALELQVRLRFVLGHVVF